MTVYNKSQDDGSDKDTPLTGEKLHSLSTFYRNSNSLALDLIILLVS